MAPFRWTDAADREILMAIMKLSGGLPKSRSQDVADLMENKVTAYAIEYSGHSWYLDLQVLILDLATASVLCERSSTLMERRVLRRRQRRRALLQEVVVLQESARLSRTSPVRMMRSRRLRREERRLHRRKIRRRRRPKTSREPLLRLRWRRTTASG